MSRLSLFVILLFCTVSVFSETKLINRKIDQKLKIFRTVAKRINMATFPTVDISVDGITIKDPLIGILYGLKRASDVYEKSTKDSVTITGQFAFEPFVLQAGELSYNDHSAPATISSSKLVADVSFTLSNIRKLGECKTTWTLFQILKFNDVSFTSEEPKDNKVITEDMNNNILPKLNSYFKSEKFLNVLNERFDLCDLLLGITHL